MSSNKTMMYITNIDALDVSPMDQPVSEPNRGSADRWLDAAYEMLLSSGVDSIRILPLARKLNLARTSFYWFFTDRDALLEALLVRWREKNTGNWIARTGAYAESICEAVLNVFDCWFDDSLFDSRHESAIRNWAQQSADVADELARADALRIAALAAMFARFGYDEMAADVRARTVYLTQIGYLSMRTQESIDIRMARIAMYVRIFTGCEPSPRDLDRFFARRGYQAPESASP